MRATPVLIALALAAVAVPAAAATAKPSPGAMFKGVSRAAMLAAAKTAPLKLIDALETYCDSDTHIADWLTQLTAGEVRSIEWSTGPCNLTNTQNPLDAGGEYCVDATIRLKHAKAHDDVPVIEIYLDDPKHGRPGPAYAFRDVFMSIDGMDYERERQAFQSQWRERFKDAPAAPCQDQ